MVVPCTPFSVQTRTGRKGAYRSSSNNKHKMEVWSSNALIVFSEAENPLLWPDSIELDEDMDTDSRDTDFPSCHSF
jgi:hypothetical protein